MLYTNSRFPSFEIYIHCVSISSHYALCSRICGCSLH